MTHDKQKPHFHFLTPDLILSLAEQMLEIKVTGLCRPYKSYINRVYELQKSDGSGIVAKFYRPERWSKQALQDEHDFLTDLAKEEIPVLAPLTLKDGTTLGSYDNTHFTFFPKKGGRNCDEFSDEQWLELGRLLGRTHAVGAMRQPQERMILTPDKATRNHISFIIQGGFVPKELVHSFAEVTEELIELIIPLFLDIKLIRIHGDCYFPNIIYRPDESFYLIDFDDMAVGPPIQDIWMLLPGYAKDTRKELNLFIEGYETFFDFSLTDIRLIEPLRAMRYIHFTAWCAHQVADGGFSVVAPGWGTKEYWQTEINDLREQIEHIKQTLAEIAD